MLLYKPDGDHQELYSRSSKSEVQRKGIGSPVLCLTTMDGGSNHQEGKSGNKPITLLLF